MEVVLESDLVDSCKPGDRVAVVGIFRPLASANGGTTSGAYRCVTRPARCSACWPWPGVRQAAAAGALCCLVSCRRHASTARAHTECAACVSCRSVVVGVSIERLTHDRYKWRGEDIANISTVAQR